MLGIQIEQEWKIDPDKRFEKFIFKTIDTSNIKENKPQSNKFEETKLKTNIQKSEQIKENFSFDTKDKIKTQKSSKTKIQKNKGKEALYELISISENVILLQKKKNRQVKKIF